MFNPRTLALALPLSLTFAAPLPAVAAENTSFTVYGGGGASSCADWSRERAQFRETEVASDFAWQQMGWVLGYVTAFGQHTPAVVTEQSGVSGDTIMAWMDAYCAEYPEDFVAVAATLLSRALAERPPHVASAQGASR